MCYRSPTWPVSVSRPGNDLLAQAPKRPSKKILGRASRATSVEEAGPEPRGAHLPCCGLPHRSRSVFRYSNQNTLLHGDTCAMIAGSVRRTACIVTSRGDRSAGHVLSLRTSSAVLIKLAYELKGFPRSGRILSIRSTLRVQPFVQLASPGGQQVCNRGGDRRVDDVGGRLLALWPLARSGPVMTTCVSGIETVDDLRRYHRAASGGR